MPRNAAHHHDRSGDRLAGRRVITQPGAVDAFQEVLFIIGKLDWTVGRNQRLTGRTIFSAMTIPSTAAAGIPRSSDRSISGTACFRTPCSWCPRLARPILNELRLQVARHQSRFSSEGAGTGVSVNINGGTVNGVNNNINFGMPTGDGEDFVQRIYQVLDNYTMLRGNHSFKVGFDYR